MKKLLPFALVLMAVFSACSEDDTTTPTTTPPTTLELVQNNWMIESIVDHNYHGSTSHLDYYDTITTAAGDYIDFRSDNTAAYRIDGDLDTVNYALVDDNTFDFDGDRFTIAKITTTAFELRFEERVDTPYYDNVIKLSR